VLCTVGALMFVINVWLSIRSISRQESSSFADTRSWRYLSVIFPYASFVIVLLLVSIVGIANPSSVYREGASFFCSVDEPVIRGVQGVAAVALFAALCFEGSIAVHLCEMHKRKLYLRRSGGPGPSYHLCIRMGLFTFYILLAITTTIFIWVKPVKTTQRPYLTFSYLVLSSFPLAVFALFGTQRDMMGAYGDGISSAWMFIRVVGEKRNPMEIKTMAECPYDLNKPLPPLPVADEINL